jgi:hypothetical protein
VIRVLFNTGQLSLVVVFPPIDLAVAPLREFNLEKLPLLVAVRQASTIPSPASEKPDFTRRFSAS